MQKAGRSERYRIYRQEKGLFVYFRGFAKTADLPYKLERSIADLFRRSRGIEVEQDSNVPTHSS